MKPRRDYEWEIRVAWAIVIFTAVLAVFVLAAYFYYLRCCTPY